MLYHLVTTATTNTEIEDAFFEMGLRRPGCIFYDTEERPLPQSSIQMRTSESTSDQHHIQPKSTPQNQLRQPPQPRPASTQPRTNNPQRTSNPTEFKSTPTRHKNQQTGASTQARGLKQTAPKQAVFEDTENKGAEPERASPPKNREEYVHSMVTGFCSLLSFFRYALLKLKTTVEENDTTHKEVGKDEDKEAQHLISLISKKCEEVGNRVP